MNYVNNTYISECIQNRDLDKLSKIFETIENIYPHIIEEIIKTNDYDIISRFGNSSYLTHHFDSNDVLDTLFIENKILELLIQNNNNFIHKYPEALMRSAVKYEDYETMRLLADKVKLNESVLLFGVYKGLDMIKFLLSIGVPRDDGSAFNGAMVMNDFDTVKYMYENDFRIEIKSIYRPKFRNDGNLTVEMVEYLINLGISDIDALLLIAIEKRNTDVIEFLLNRGAKILIYSETVKFDIFVLLFINKINVYQNGLFDSIIYFDNENIQYLIDNGLDIHYNQDILLSLSVYSEFQKKVVLLLENGASANGNEPLFFACMYGNLSIVKHLLNYGSIFDNMALKCACVSGKLTLVEYLIDQYNAIPCKETLLVTIQCLHIDIFNYLINIVDTTECHLLLNECFENFQYDFDINFYNRNTPFKLILEKKERSLSKKKNEACMIYNLMMHCNPISLKNMYETLKDKMKQIKKYDEYDIFGYLHSLGIETE